MGCQSEVYIDHYFTFSIVTHDPDTGVVTNADANPAYRIYEDETAGAILTGTMAALDAGNTTGFYTERIQATAGAGFEHGKSYSIYILAQVDGDTGGIALSFRALTAPNNLSTAEVNTEVVDALNTDTYGEPGQEAPAETTTLVDKIGYLYKFLRNKLTQTATTLNVYNDAGAVVDQKSTVSDDGDTFTRGEIESGP